MVEYEIRKALYAFIGVLKNPKMHWLDTLGWIMVELMYAQVINTIRTIVSIVNYVPFSCNEVSMVDNGSWISIYAYVM